MTKEQIEEKKTRERYYFEIRIKAEQKIEKAQKSIQTISEMFLSRKLSVSSTSLVIAIKNLTQTGLIKARA